MKNLRYMLLATAVAAGAAFAQSPAPADGPDFVTASVQAASPTQAAAARGLHAFAARFARNAGQRPQGFPLAVRDLGELSHAHIGWGFQVYDVTASALASGADLEADAQPTGIWRYEVILHGRAVGLLTLARTVQGWQVVSMGGAGLVDDIQTVVGAYGGGAGNQLRYVRVPQATADFIQVKRGAAAAQYAPLQAARGSLRVQAAGAAGAGLLNGSDLRQQLRQAVARSATN